MIYASPYYFEGFKHEKDFDQQIKYQTKEIPWFSCPHGVENRQAGVKP